MAYPATAGSRYGGTGTVKIPPSIDGGIFVIADIRRL